MGKKKVIKQSEEQVLKEETKLSSAMAKAGDEVRATGKRVEAGRVYINATFNNTIVTVTDRSGNVLAWGTAGALGFSGPKKATPFAASKVVAAIAEKLKKTGLATVDVIVRGIGSGRDSAIRSLATQGFNIVSIRDVTPIPHNGPRRPKERRV